MKKVFFIFLLGIIFVSLVASQPLLVKTNQGWMMINNSTNNHEAITIVPVGNGTGIAEYGTWNLAAVRAALLIADSTKWNSMLPLASVYASIDSFSTSSQSKEITVSGAVVGGSVHITPAYPAYSAIADTGQEYSGVVKAGGGAIIVTRTNRVPASTIKSAAIFNWEYIKPR
jgi:hypothetical protein